jgi:tRNA nucleotidyltransferase (CCA-adding enzyme)
VHAWIRQVEEQDQIKKFQPPIDGEEIMLIFALNPCKEIGIIKNSIKNAILDGEISNTYEAAHSLLIKKGLEFGFTVKNTMQ